MNFIEEQTDSSYISTLRCNQNKDYIVEVFLKDKGFIWYAVLRYKRIPSKAIIIRDTYNYKCKSPRPYMAGQACDGSISSPVFHIYNQLCTMLGIDPIITYNKAYDDHIFTQSQLDVLVDFANWQGVEIIHNWSEEKILQVITSIHEVNMHQLANTISELL